MDWHDTVADGLPAPRADEPPSLRQDITDELSDHLHCALDRERRRVVDEDDATRNVLARFGDVRRTARRLWLDAMKEKIMAQRITLALVVVMAVASVAAGGLAWVAMQDGRQVNAAILERLDALAREPTADAVPLDWIPVKVRLVPDETGGVPPEKFKVSLSGELLQDGKEILLREQPAADGWVDFGRVRPGQYRLEVEAPWSEEQTRSVTVRPGKVATESITYPAQPLENATIEPQVKWPADLTRDDLWVLCTFYHVPREVDGALWEMPRVRRDGGVVSFSHGEYELISIPSGRVSFADDFTVLAPPIDPAADHTDDPPPWTRLKRVRIRGKLEFQQQLRLPAGKYRLASLLVTVPTDREPDGGSIPTIWHGMVASDPHIEPTDVLTFTATPGEPNRWTIPVPQAWAEEIRDYLRSR